VITLVAVLRKQAPAKLNKICLSPFEKKFNVLSQILFTVFQTVVLAFIPLCKGLRKRDHLSRGSEKTSTSKAEQNLFKPF
jgi:hypothetical protein